MSITQSSARELLHIWERGVLAPSVQRGDALLNEPARTSSLGARNGALLAERAKLFGGAQALRCNCGACGATTEFTIDCVALAQSLPRAPDDALQLHSLNAAGYLIEFRVPLVTDVAHAASAAIDRETFVQALLDRCVSSCLGEDAIPCEPAALPPEVAAALSMTMEQLDQGAIVSFEVTCPECQGSWNARMDCADLLWSEVQSRAEQLLLDVDALARTYRWSETNVLDLSATRRAAYLQLIGAA